MATMIRMTPRPAKTPALFTLDAAGSVPGKDQLARFVTLAGPVCVAFSDAGVTMVERGADARDFERSFLARFGRDAEHVSTPPAWLAAAVAHWFDPDHTPAAAWRFDLRGTPAFAQEVLRATYAIPRGETRGYGELAAAIGHPGAARAVGTALANNPIPLFIPCHRVVRADGHIGRYSGGDSAVKDALLRWEAGESGALTSLIAP